VSRSSPKPNFFRKKRDFFLLALVLVVVAAVYSQKPTPSRATISGLDLRDDRESVASALNSSDHRRFQPNEFEEHWSRMESPSIQVEYDESGSVHKITGGVPEIDGVDARAWTALQFEEALGPPPHGGSSRTIGEQSRSFLAYPEHRLLIYLEPEGNRFLLFESGRS